MNVKVFVKMLELSNLMKIDVDRCNIITDLFRALHKKYTSSDLFQLVTMQKRINQTLVKKVKDSASQQV